MIFIVIAVHNRKDFTRNCLCSLRKQTFKDYQIIIVDDGSTDGTSEVIMKEFPEVYIIKGDGNLWWAGATNAGIEYILENGKPSDSDFLLTLNNDLEVPEQYLETLFKNTSIYTKSILGSVSVDIKNPERLSFCGVSWSEYTGRHHLKAKYFRYSYSELIKHEVIINSDMLPGRGTLIPIKVFNEIGVYDSINFPQYAADEDFSLRAKRNGWSLIIPVNTYVKSHIDETGVDVENVQFSLGYFKYLFFSIKSPLNIRIRYRWAIKNTKLKFFYFVLDCSRIMLSMSFKIIRGTFRSHLRFKN